MRQTTWKMRLTSKTLACLLILLPLLAFAPILNAAEEPLETLSSASAAPDSVEETAPAVAVEAEPAPTTESTPPAELAPATESAPLVEAAAPTETLAPTSETLTPPVDQPAVAATPTPSAEALLTEREAVEWLKKIQFSSDYLVDEAARVIRWSVTLKSAYNGVAQLHLAMIEPSAVNTSERTALQKDSYTLGSEALSPESFLYDKDQLMNDGAVPHNEKTFSFEMPLQDGVTDYRLKITPALLEERATDGRWYSLFDRTLERELQATVAAQPTAIEPSPAPSATPTPNAAPTPALAPLSPLKPNRALAPAKLELAPAADGSTLAAPALAPLATRNLTLQVNNPDGTPLAGASVVVKNAAGTTVFSGTSNSSGQVSVTGLTTTEDYFFTVTANGYEPLNYTLPAGSATSASLIMTPATTSTNTGVTSISGVLNADGTITWTARFNTQATYYPGGYTAHISLGEGLGNPTMISPSNLVFSGSSFSDKTPIFYSDARTYIFKTMPDMSRDYFTVTTSLQDHRLIVANKVEGTASATLLLVRVKTINPVYPGATTVSGTASPNSLIQVKDAAGMVIGSALSDASGNYTVTIPAQSVGTVLTVVANYNGSSGLSTTVVQDILSSAQAMTNPLGTATTVSGVAAPGAVITIKSGNTVLATTSADASGKFSATLTPAQAAGTVLTVTATYNSGTSSRNVTVEQGYSSVGGYRLYGFSGTLNSGMIFDSTVYNAYPLDGLDACNDKDYIFCVDPWNKVPDDLSPWSIPYSKYYNGVGTYLTAAQVEAIKPILLWAELYFILNDGDYATYLARKPYPPYALGSNEIRSMAITAAIYSKLGRPYNLIFNLYMSEKEGVFGPNASAYAPDPDGLYSQLINLTANSPELAALDYANSYLNIYVDDAGREHSQSVASATLVYRPTTFPFYVKKVDPQGAPITSGTATFTLTGPAPATTQRTADTDATGVAYFADLPAGTYSLAETAAPVGYSLDSTTRTVVVTSSGGVTVDGTALTDVPPVYNFTNAPATNGFINIHKKLQESLVPNAPITGFNGVTFELRVSNAEMTEKNGALVGLGSNSATTGVAVTSTLAAVGQTQAQDGSATFTKLPNGYYYLKETNRPAAPGGASSAYDGERVEAFFKIENDQSYVWQNGAWKSASSDAASAADKDWGFDFYNRYTRKYPLRLQKVDSNFETITSGEAFFEIYAESSFTVAADGKLTINIGATPLLRATTANGFYTSTAIFTQGRYALLETRAPTGYTQLLEPVLLSLEQGEWKLPGTNAGVHILPLSQGNAVQVVNRKPVYPQTGGQGTWPYMGGGLLLMLLAVCLPGHPRLRFVLRANDRSRTTERSPSSRKKKDAPRPWREKTRRSEERCRSG